MTEIFLTVLDMSMTATLVILAVLLGRLLLRRQPKVFSYALWSVVLFRLLCPVSISGPLSLVQVTQPRVEVHSAAASSVSYFSETVQERTETTAENTPMPVEAGKRETISAVSAVSWIWGAGVLAMASYGVYSLVSLRRQLLGAVRMQRGVYTIDHIPSAFVLGLLWPTIYLPSGLSQQETMYILAHERCHIRRGDPIIKVLAYAALCLHWFHPLVWLAYILAGKDMEMSCDEAVMRQLGEVHRADYAQVLLKQTAHSRHSLAVLSFGSGDTKARIRNMADWKKPKSWMVAAAMILCGVILGICVVNPRSADMGYGKWAGDGTCEELTQADYTDYLKQAYGLSQITDHRVFHQDGFFQVDIQFEEDTRDWQWESGLNFAVNKFYYRDMAKYDLYAYDLWLIEHAQERTRGLVYRCFVGDRLQMLVSYPEDTFAQGQKLRLTVHPSAEQGGRVRFEPEELGGNFPDGMTYSQIGAVDLTLEENTLPLEEALRNGLLTADDLFSMARVDARAGICEEIHESNQGVAGYTFRYEDYSILWVNDLYETPSGELDPIHYLVIYLHSSPEGTVSYQYRPDGTQIDLETGLYNDREDWGLHFAVVEASPTGVTLRCTQSGGQQVGTLCIAWSFLSDGSWPVDRIIREDGAPWMEIPMDQESEITIDWSSLCGEKAPGSYDLELYIQDQYEEEQLHPLMEKFHDIQQYRVEFTIS